MKKFEWIHGVNYCLLWWKPKPVHKIVFLASVQIARGKKSSGFYPARFQRSSKEHQSLVTLINIQSPTTVSIDHQDNYVLPSNQVWISWPLLSLWRISLSWRNVSSQKVDNGRQSFWNALAAERYLFTKVEVRNCPLVGCCNLSSSTNTSKEAPRNIRAW